MSAKNADEGKRPRRRTAAEDEGASTPTVTTPTKNRRRPGLVALGIALAAVCALGTWWYVNSASNTVTVVTTKADIPRGQMITQNDLTTLQIAGGQSTDALTASEASTILGEVALVDLPKGSLVTTSNVGESLVVTAGKSLVGVALTSAQMPSQQLAAGDEVRIVDTPISQGEPPADTPTTFTAVVFSVRADEANARWIVDLIVSKDKAPDIAARAATGRVALILDSGE